MIQSLKGARRQSLVSLRRHAPINSRENLGSVFPARTRMAKGMTQSEPRDEEKRKPETILKVMLSTAATGMLEDMAGKELDRKRDCQ